MASKKTDYQALIENGRPIVAECLRKAMHHWSCENDFTTMPDPETDNTDPGSTLGEDASDVEDVSTAKAGAVLKVPNETGRTSNPTMTTDVLGQDTEIRATLPMNPVLLEFTTEILDRARDFDEICITAFENLADTLSSKRNSISSTVPAPHTEMITSASQDPVNGMVLDVHGKFSKEHVGESHEGRTSDTRDVCFRTLVEAGGGVITGVSQNKRPRVMDGTETNGKIKLFSAANKHEWRLEPSTATRHLIVADSNMKGAATVPVTWELIVFPGARFQHIADAVERSSKAHRDLLETLYLQVGINHRDDISTPVLQFLRCKLHCLN
jgi:hypothetical protein